MMEQRTRKQRINVDLPQEQVRWAEQAALKLSLERGKKVSRNQLISEALEIYKKHLEESNN